MLDQVLAKDNRIENQQPRVNVLERCPTNQIDSAASTEISAPPATPNREVVFGEVV